MEDPKTNPVATMRDAMETHLPATVIEKGGLTLIDRATTREIIDKTQDALAHQRKSDALNPVRRMGTARLNTLGSLIDWVNRYKGETSALFLDIDRGESQYAVGFEAWGQAVKTAHGSVSQTETTTRTTSFQTASAVTLRAVINYHAGGPPADITDEKGEDTARHGDHVGVYDFPLSEAWRRWTGMAGEKMDVASFGRFIEDNAPDLLDPTPFIQDGEHPVGDDEDSVMNWEIEARKIASRLKAEFAGVSRMIDLGRSFSVVVDEAVAVKVDRQSGRANMRIEENHSDEEGQELRLPRLFLISIPVFDMGDHYPIVCTFSYSARGGVTLSFALFDAAAAFDYAINEVAAIVDEETGLPLFHGIPETF